MNELNPAPCSDKARIDLEWDRLVRAIADRTASVDGRVAAAKLPFLVTRRAVEQSFDELREALALELGPERLPVRAFPSIGETTRRAQLGASLGAAELIAVKVVLDAVTLMRRFLKANREKLPMLCAASNLPPSLDGLSEELERSFDADGSLRDSASPRLLALRSELRSSSEHLKRRLDELIGKHRELLTDGYWTERDGRYVLPVRSDTHERFPGIVHATSAGGATLFVEPRVIVPMGNRHKVLAAQVEHEENTIFAALSALVATHAEDLTTALATLTQLDVRAAEARLARDLSLNFPRILEEPKLRLVRLRHPLLELDGTKVVPSDISLDAGRALVVSGPNAGGKTVALKAVGLSALMIRAGLPIPASEQSEVALFDDVFTDVGDDQSITKNLSTFSAHIKNLADILDGAHRGSIVLLDEVASGTDPREGEALAAVVLEALCRRGAAVACTTHYEGLKVLAFTDDSFANASVGFDIDTMTPTFRLSLGVPGASSALAVARRFGISEALITRARARLDEQTKTLDALVGQLERERERFETERAQLLGEREALDQERRTLEDERAKQKEREERALAKESLELVGSVKRAKEELRAAQARLRHPSLDARQIADVEKAITQVARKVAIGGELELKPEEPSRDPVVRDAVAVGMRVYVPRLRTEAEVLDVLPGGQLRVAAGPMKLLTSIDEVLSAKPAKKAKQPKPPRPIAFDAAADPDVPMQTSDNTVDLRGLRSHEVVNTAEQFLDRCVSEGRRVAFLVHGHGTGALRQILREMLRTSRYVEQFRGGEPREGGDGVTVVWLR